MKRKIKFAVLIAAVAIGLVIAGMAIATALYSGDGIQVKVPRITITWETVRHDLWLGHYSTTDSGQTATSAK